MPLKIMLNGLTRSRNSTGEVCWYDVSVGAINNELTPGMSNGGHIIGHNYEKFPRFRLIDIARNNTDLIDAKMTKFAESHCTTDCDREGIIKAYDITGPQDPKEDIYKYKYLLDVDGNTFSGRYLGLLRSGSLVFKVRGPILITSSGGC